MQSLSLRLTPPTTLFPLSFLNSFKSSSSGKKKRFCDANTAISLLSISVPSPDSYSWSSERIVYSCRNVFNSVEDVLICHQVCFSLEVHWRSANHNPSPCRWEEATEQSLRSVLINGCWKTQWRLHSRCFMSKVFNEGSRSWVMN